MPILTIIIAIVCVGVLLWAVDRFVPMEGNTKMLLKIVVIAALVLWLLDVFGILDRLGSVTV